MAFEFDGIGNGGFPPPPLRYGRLRDCVLPKDMPDNVSWQIELKRIVETSSFPDEDAMTKVVARTCTAEFHKRKGYLDSEEQSALTFRELEKLFDIHLPDKPIDLANILIEHEDCYIYIHSGNDSDKITINPAEFKVPADERFIIYILNQDVIDKLQQEKKYIQHCEEIFDRLTAKDQKKPVLVFRWVDDICRGDYMFSAPAILMKLNEHGFEQILQFQGIYTYSRKIKSGVVVLRRMSGSNGKRYDVVRLKTIQQFIDYWAWIFKYWLIMCKIPSCDPFSKHIIKLGLLDELMPNPYVGNPFKCSAVILNYNPGATKARLNNLHADPQHNDQQCNPNTICGHMAHDYWRTMQSGEYFDFGNECYPEHKVGQDDGPKWWAKRKTWIDDGLIPNSGLNPFGLEICGWHSNNWKGISYTKYLLQSLKNRLAGVIEESIKNSALGITISYYFTCIWI